MDRAVERARLLLDANRPEQAIRELTAHLATNSDDPQALELLAVAHLDTDPWEALDRARDLQAVAPEDPFGFIHASQALSRLDRHCDAAAAAMHAIKLAPTLPVTHRTLACAYLSSADLEHAALGHARWAFNLDPMDSTNAQVYADALAAGGQRREAVAMYETALQLDADNTTARHNLELIRRMRWRRFPTWTFFTSFGDILRADPQNQTARKNIAFAQRNLVTVGYLVWFVGLVAVIVIPELGWRSGARWIGAGLGVLSPSVVLISFLAAPRPVRPIMARALLTVGTACSLGLLVAFSALLVYVAVTLPEVPGLVTDAGNRRPPVPLGAVGLVIWGILAVMRRRKR